MAIEVMSVAELGALGEQLGAGGQGWVYMAPGLSLPDAPGPLVFKKYKPGQQPSLHGLRRLVRLRIGLNPTDLHRLDQLTVWPLRIVEDAGRVSGVVLRLIPPAFFHERVLPGTGRQDRSVREIQNLLIPAERARTVGMPVASVDERLGICRDFAAVLHMLHRHALVVGDLNAKNALFRLGEYPAVMLLDCDAIRIKGSAAGVAQLNTPDWDPPERQLTQQSDRYKYGLFVLRCLAEGAQKSTTRDPSRADAALDPEGRLLLRAALSDVPAQRPTAQDWGRYFQFLLTGQRVAPLVVPPHPVPSPRRQGAVATTGWVRDPATGRWKAR